MQPILSNCMEPLIFAARKVCIIVVYSLTVMSCAPASPDQKAVDVCKATASARARGLPLIPSDIGELVEECMAGRGFALIETSPGCSGNFASATNRTCYYRNTLPGRFYARFKH